MLCIGSILFKVHLVRYRINKLFRHKWGDLMLLNTSSNSVRVYLTPPMIIVMAELSWIFILLAWTLCSHASEQYSELYDTNTICVIVNNYINTIQSLL